MIASSLERGGRALLYVVCVAKTFFRRKILIVQCEEKTKQIVSQKQVSVYLRIHSGAKVLKKLTEFFRLFFLKKLYDSKCDKSRKKC